MMRVPSHPSNRICIECKIEKKRRQMFTFAEFPEEDGYTWCSDKCLMVWIVKHQLKENGQLITEFEDKKTRQIKFSVSDLTPEDLVGPQMHQV